MKSSGRSLNRFSRVHDRTLLMVTWQRHSKTLKKHQCQHNDQRMPADDAYGDQCAVATRTVLLQRLDGVRIAFRLRGTRPRLLNPQVLRLSWTTCRIGKQKLNGTRLISIQIRILDEAFSTYSSVLLRHVNFVPFRVPKQGLQSTAAAPTPK